MKYFLVLLAILYMSSAYAETVVLYEDGSTYTLEEGEQVYISKKGVFSATGGLSQWLTIKRMKPWSKRDYTGPTESEIDQCEVGLGFGHVNCPPEEEEQEEDNPFTFGG